MCKARFLRNDAWFPVAGEDLQQKREFIFISPPRMDSKFDSFDSLTMNKKNYTAVPVESAHYVHVTLVLVRYNII